MNKPLVERIENRARHGATGSIAESDLQSILADVRELVEAAQQFRCDFSPAVPKDETIAYVFTVGQYNRLSEILRKVGGDIGTAPSLPAVEPQNSAVKVPDEVMESAEFLAQWCPGHGLYRDHASAILSYLQTLTHPTETPR